MPTVLKSVRVQTALAIGLVAIALVTGLCGLFSSMLQSQIERDRSAALADAARSMAMNLERSMQDFKRPLDASGPAGPP